MDRFAFDALGTRWSIDIDGGTLSVEARDRILGFVRGFEDRFSRFINRSEVNMYRELVRGEYSVSLELGELLGRAAILRELTGGMYDPAVGQLLERAGYDASYRFEPAVDTDGFVLPEWSIDGNRLTIGGPIVFDLGGIGKRYCIDRVADIVAGLGYRHFLIEGGGDMYGTTKADGSAWRVAVEWPGQSDTAAGIVELALGGFAASDSFKRRWKDWHHIVDPHTRSAVRRVIGCAVVASSAWDADTMTSGLFLAPPNQYSELAKCFRAEYLVFLEDGTVMKSSAWKGELYV